ncbi:gamma carbonic anhydrase family protein [Thermoanaerobacter pentosaceus]|uniref:Carbonic anhydrase/acetyltransferase-like protein (Isoleucine patch superfamily) n=1 Tax=Thermoanaerobacter pentosaceus TaxID=694059 RepID=A0ABT9M0G1_9THEO|nr:gamma carbonic anhydrase family protein [Thermoanaerobacter pentosaceus]MDP9749610.1 carbonic anhydrase/acetyltransferase-like protein (isoleucine patch superfamily) [Thermoanaerobacter pentosaceus]
MIIKEYKGMKPKIDDQVYIAETAEVIGDVEIKKDVNIWYGAVLRGDIDKIVVGEGTNIQDNCVVHVTEDYPCYIGNYCTIGHGAILHACKIGNNVLIGMGAIILDDAEIGDNCIIGAGSLVTGGKKIPEGSLAFGNPAKVIRKLTQEEIENIRRSYEYYVELAKLHFSNFGQLTVYNKSNIIENS